MAKRLFLILALSAGILACTPAPGTTVAPAASDAVPSAAPSDAAPSESMAPSAS